MRPLAKAVVIAAVTLLLYCAIDEAAWFALRQTARGKLGYLQSFPPYHLEPAASPDFEREVAAEPGGWHSIPGYRLLQPNEYHGTYFNVDVLPPTGLAYRRTLCPAGSGRLLRTLLLLGGSTVYGPMVADGSTLASALCDRLAASDPRHAYRICNAGVIGAGSAQERDRLRVELARGLKPDIAISVDGDIDAVSGVYYADPEREDTLVASRIEFEGLLRRLVPMHIYGFLRSWAEERRARGGGTGPPAHLSQPARLAALVASTGDIYFKRHLAMAEAASAAGVRYMAVLGPHPFGPGFAHPTADIGDVRRRAEARYPGLPQAVAAAWPALARAILALHAEDVETLDLSDALIDKTDDVYYDMGHYNGIG